MKLFERRRPGGRLSPRDLGTSRGHLPDAGERPPTFEAISHIGEGAPANGQARRHGAPPTSSRGGGRTVRCLSGWIVGAIRAPRMSSRLSEAGNTSQSLRKA
ncbi:hypothetical protein VTO73DRAFT_242 [Trametes versicolor]